MRSLVAGNWKMNGLAADAMERAEALAAMARRGRPCDLLLCPPATLIAGLGTALAGSGIALGGQDCHGEDKGAFTGDIAAAMLADLGCSHVIVGHSERRRDHGETDAQIAAKAAAAHRAGLVAIVCVGESGEDRTAGRAGAVVQRQLERSLPTGATSVNTVVAYEPVWAVGSGKAATVADIRNMHGGLRAHLLAAHGDDGRAFRLLYGGSVSIANANTILALDDVGGALVGGASLDPDAFWRIAEGGRAD